MNINTARYHVRRTKKIVSREAKRSLGIDRPVARRKEFNKLFCVGWLKTGTTSFGVACRELGLAHCGYDQDVLHWYRQGKLGKIIDQARFFESFDDLPWNKHELLCELDSRFPGSKFVLLERSVTAWAESYERHEKRKQPTKIDVQGAVDYFVWRNQFIKEYFRTREKSEQLLVMNICEGEGYERLCPFLRLARPDRSFPYINRFDSARVPQR